MDRRLLLVAPLLALAAGACKSAPEVFPDRNGEIAPAPVRVEFRPPAGERIVERSVTLRTERRGKEQVREEVRATLESRFDRRERGWALTQAITRVEVKHGGEIVDNALVQLVTKFPIRVRLAEDGAFVELENAEEIEAAVRQAFSDPAEAEVILRYFAPEALEAQVRREWDGKYGGLLGREVAPGFAVYQVDSVSMGDGAEVHFVVERKVAGVRTRAHGRELVLTLSCPTNIKDAARPQEMMLRLEEAGAPPLNANVRCEGEQVIGLEPFSPRATALQVSAKVMGEDGPVELLLVKELNTEPLAGTGVKQEAR